MIRISLNLFLIFCVFSVPNVLANESTVLKKNNSSIKKSIVAKEAIEVDPTLPKIAKKGAGEAEYSQGSGDTNGDGVINTDDDINDFNNDGVINQYDDLNGDGIYDSKDAAVLVRDSQSAINFKPVPGDISVTFLGNIFGVVDGVLAGNGSQVAGQIFGVFNTAVLALAGMMVFYTLLVSTMNTAQEGQYIGKRWASVLVPIRSITGVALLLPKVSGFCLLQIFIMWVVIQGVGAADKVWNQALSYLNRGGTIVKPNVDPITNLKNNGGNKIFDGAYGILAGEVCMAALYKKLESYQQTISTTAPCTDSNNDPGGVIDTFCKTAVPNFIDSVNFVTNTVLEVPSSELASVPMPNFSVDMYPYNVFNGVCGTVQFHNFSAPENMGLTPSEKITVNASRAIAVNQMYIFLAPTAQMIVENGPAFNTSISCEKEPCVNNVIAQYPWGVPLTLKLDYCKAQKNTYQTDANGRESYKDNSCLSWEVPQGSIANSVLLRGTEVQDAIATYNGMMSASLYINSQSSDSSNYKSERNFISEARQSGWLLAGAYYFRLAILTSKVLEKSNSIYSDDKSGLQVCQSTGGDNKKCGAGSWTTDSYNNFFTQSGNNGCKVLDLAGVEYVKLFCATDGTPGTPTNVNSDIVLTMTKDIIELISGKRGDLTSLGGSIPKFPRSDLEDPVYGLSATEAPHNNNFYHYPNSVYGFIINSTAVVLPGQPGDAQPVFTLSLNYNSSSEVPQMGDAKMSGGKWRVPGQVMSAIFKYIFKYMFNFLIELILPMYTLVMFAFLQPPVIVLSSTFLGAMEVMKDPNVNPILGLANMGIGFIEGSVQSFFVMAGVAISMALIPGALPLYLCLLPAVMTWLGIMTGVGITATFYLPVVPFIIFLFASIGWFIGVIEAMVAAPLMALGAMNPDGEHPFGKSDQAFMLLLGIFLRPSMMIMGYIFGIILSYVGIWFINAGFVIVMAKIRGIPRIDSATGFSADYSDWGTQYVGGNSSTYGMWSTIFLFFFLLMTYISTIMAVVNKSFELIHHLPDKILRWVSGGQATDLGQSTVASSEKELKDAQKKGSAASSTATAKFTAGAMSKTVQIGKKAGKKAKGMLSKSNSTASSSKNGSAKGSKKGGDDSSTKAKLAGKAAGAAVGSKLGPVAGKVAEKEVTKKVDEKDSGNGNGDTGILKGQVGGANDSSGSKSKGKGKGSDDGPSVEAQVAGKAAGKGAEAAVASELGPQAGKIAGKIVEKEVSENYDEKKADASSGGSQSKSKGKDKDKDKDKGSGNGPSVEAKVAGKAAGKGAEAAVASELGPQAGKIAGKIVEKEVTENYDEKKASAVSDSGGKKGETKKGRN